MELKTKTKMFCGCLNDPDEKHPNINVCPICLAHPGTLPTINKKAVEAVLKLGLALNSQIPKESKFDRKNYFYPDLPKGYQISQYDQPLVLGGELNNIKLRRIHLEEDTASLIHGKKGESLVDFNRAGVPLMELVTEPDIKSGKEATDFAKELRLILRYLDISDADMEKGQMRIEANISVSKDNELGTKVEVKNLNSFRSVEESIDYEIKRQAEILESGEKIIHETRGFDENKRITVSQRLKEEAHDYRYFPEPDLPSMDSAEFDLKKLKSETPELPKAKRQRFKKEFFLKDNQAEILVNDKNFANYFEKAAAKLISSGGGENSVQILYNCLTSDLKGLMREMNFTIEEIKIAPENSADLTTLIISGGISSSSAKYILREMAETGLNPRQIIEEKNLTQISDDDIIKQTIQVVIKDNPKAIEDYKKGKENALQFLIGQAMAKLKGRGNPEILRKILKETI